VNNASVFDDGDQLVVVPTNLSYCGDGRISDDEACDDANRRDGDGCDGQCRVELEYQCTGEVCIYRIYVVGAPSRCYRHVHDGVCEWFEMASSVDDCGHYTPVDYDDQWVHTATLSGTMCMHNNEHDDCSAEQCELHKLVCVHTPHTAWTRRWAHRRPRNVARARRRRMDGGRVRRCNCLMCG
jgi:cysteine-rich repeat protein